MCSGLDGIRYVLESSKNLPVDFFIMLPSCVPATHLETAGARITADDLRLMIGDERIAGVAELMNFPGVFLGTKSELAKIEAGKGKAIDGHAPGLRGKNLNAYALAGVRSDHESIEVGGSAGEAAARHAHPAARRQHGAQSGASACRCINAHNSQNCSFATDDKLAGDLVNEGHIDHAVRKADQGRRAADHRAANRHHQHRAPLSAAQPWRDRAALLGGLHRVRRLEKVLASARLTKRACSWRRTASISREIPARVPLPRSTMNLRYKPADLAVKAARAEDSRHRDRSRTRS